VSPPSQRGLGPRGGVAVEHFEPGAVWVALCANGEATADETADVALDARGRPRPPLAVWLESAGSRERIDALLAVAPGGRFLVLLRDGQAMLRDTRSGREHALAPLDPDLRADADPEHRSFAFSARGDALLVLRRAGAALLDLGADDPLAGALTLDTGPRPVWRVRASGAYFVLDTLPEGSEPRSWPVPLAPRPLLRCAGATFSAYARRSGPLADPKLEAALLLAEPRPRARAAPAPAITPAPGFLQAFGAGWLRRENDGRLLIVEGSRQRQLASARCGARVLVADERSGWVLVSCEEYRPTRAPAPPSPRAGRRPPPRLRFPLALVRPGAVRELELEMMRTGADVSSGPSPRLVSLRPGAEAVLLELTSATLYPLPESALVLVTGDDGALLATERGLVHWTKAAERRIAERPLSPVPLLLSRSSVAVGTRVYRLESGSVTEWTLPAAPLALGAEGDALVPEERATPERWARGPLYWHAAPPPAQVGSGLGVVGPEAGSSGALMSSAGSAPVSDFIQLAMSFASAAEMSRPSW
jgi:hypothetical protein